ncbi:uncharacterized protein LOC141620047 [Silene latifolia]|uniref:uncharacterized protein LOC141620047 n=1 Tax=Silene latifolia TaxID=37657 RepID=UPI003D788232
MYIAIYPSGAMHLRLQHLHLTGRCPSKSVEKTSYEIWTGNVPKLSFVKIWECEAYVRKLIPEKCSVQNCSTLRVQDSKLPTHESREFLSKGNSGSKVDLEEVQDVQVSLTPTEAVEERLDSRDVIVSQSVQDTPISEDVVPRRSTRSNFGRDPDRYHDLYLIENDEPSSYKEPMMGPDFEKWLVAMNFEMDSMYRNQVWTLVDPHSP